MNETTTEKAARKLANALETEAREAAAEENIDIHDQLFRAAYHILKVDNSYRVGILTLTEWITMTHDVILNACDDVTDPDHELRKLATTTLQPVAAHLEQSKAAAS